MHCILVTVEDNLSLCTVFTPLTYTKLLYLSQASSLFLSLGGRIYRFHAQSAGAGPGQEERGALRQGVERGRSLSLHCDRGRGLLALTSRDVHMTCNQGVETREPQSFRGDAI